MLFTEMGTHSRVCFYKISVQYFTFVLFSAHHLQARISAIAVLLVSVLYCAVSYLMKNDEDNLLQTMN